MDEVRRRDRRLFVGELFYPPALILTAIVLVVFLLPLNPGSLFYTIGVTFAIGGGHALFARQRAREKSFAFESFRALWSTCENRLVRFRAAIRTMRRHSIADFDELPKTIEKVAQNVYTALRRADIVFGELNKSEGALMHAMPRVPAGRPDAQTVELLRIADRNIAEYRQHYNGLMNTLHMTEAQAAVFATTLDTLRIKMLGYRLSDRRPATDNREFLESLTEARMQLDAIDKALVEIELTPFPKTITVLPDEPNQNATV